MDTVLFVWDSLTEDQRKVWLDVGRALMGVSPQQEPERLTVSQVAERFGRSTSAIYKAMDEHRLPYTTPHGQTKPRYVKVSDVRKWLGWT
ncbi:MAG: helix-turn-helix domain-containing protein [Akkermansia sp.]|nr:helix-turn-helix domain-containing protein [Akkermansia sp.]MBR3387496.1 helix-turn-helix domain-containing protein [Bacteroidales bacterium]